jgi:ABC-2 type transport system permease protein
MTAIETRAAAPAAPPLAVRAGNVLTSEWIKLRSIRSTYLIMLIVVTTALGLSGLIADMKAIAVSGRPPGDPMLPTFMGMPYAALAAGLLGVLAFGSEHGTGLVRTTFAAVPRRRAVLAAKVTITGAVALALGEAPRGPTASAALPSRSPPCRSWSSTRGPACSPRPCPS